jgi:hypothetical protein
MKKIIFLCLILFPNKGLIGSVNNNPFDFFSLSIELLKNVNNNDLHYFYQPQNGLKTSFSSPFYWGNIQASLDLMPFNGKEKDYINFIGIQPKLKWIKPLYTSSKISFAIGGGVGLFVFSFTDQEDRFLLYNWASITESELSSGCLSQIQYFINKKLSLTFNINIDRVHTYKPINLINISMGIAYRNKTPDWIKLILQ